MGRFERWAQKVGHVVFHREASIDILSCSTFSNSNLMSSGPCSVQSPHRVESAQHWVMRDDRWTILKGRDVRIHRGTMVHARVRQCNLQGRNQCPIKTPRGEQQRRNKGVPPSKSAGITVISAASLRPMSPREASAKEVTCNILSQM